MDVIYKNYKRCGSFVKILLVTITLYLMTLVNFCPILNNSSAICGKFGMEDLNTIALGSLRVS